MEIPLKKRSLKTDKNIRSVYLQNQRAIVSCDIVAEFRVALKLTLEVK